MLRINEFETSWGIVRFVAPSVNEAGEILMTIVWGDHQATGPATKLYRAINESTSSEHLLVLCSELSWSE
ncbi:MAG: hypothetical protein KDB11_33750 [Planctomycetales bacterium]|nr:hypothetical protein [Planctomycetales bacterium]